MLHVLRAVLRDAVAELSTWPLKPLFGASLVAGVALTQLTKYTYAGSTFEQSGILSTKILAFTNLLALHSLWRQRKGYAKIVGAQVHTSDSPSLLKYFPVTASGPRPFDALLVTGMGAAVLLFFGVMETASCVVMTSCLISAVSRVRPFCDMQMFSQLHEANTVLALASLVQPWSSVPLAFGQQWLSFRLMFGSGLGKLYAGSGWDDLSAMYYHYWTTPLPNPLSPLCHRLPLWFHRLETLGSLLIEGPAAILQLLPWQVCRSACFLLYGGLMTAIVSTGNYGHVGWLTLAQCVALLDDTVLDRMSNGILRGLLDKITLWRQLPLPDLDLPREPFLYAGMTLIAGYFLLSLYPLHATFARWMPIPKLLLPLWRRLEPAYQSATRYFLLEKYVKFGDMATYKPRQEVIIQVSASDNGAGFVDWLFLYKPSDLDELPPFVPPGKMPGIDWQCWRLAQALRRNAYQMPYPQWFSSFLQRLQARDSDVCALMGPCPLPKDQPIRRMRVMLYDYRYVWEKNAPRPWTLLERADAMIQASAHGVELGEEAGTVWWRRPVTQWGEVLHFPGPAVRQQPVAGPEEATAPG